MNTYVRHANQLDNLPAGKLRHLDIELTERCNNNCIHCCINLPLNDEKARQNEMALEQIQDNLKQAADLGCITVRFTGGEPLLRPDFPIIYEYTRRLGMRVQLFTNARLITPGLVQLFSRIPPLEIIEVTSYGMSDDSYAAITQQHGTFKSFTRGIQLLQEYKIPFVLKSVLLPINRHELAEFDAWVKSLPWSNGTPSISMFYYLRSRRDDPAKNQAITELRITPKEAVDYMSRHETDWQQFKLVYEQSPPKAAGNQLFNCGAGQSQLCIDAYGRVQACMLLRTPELVKARGTALADALEYFKDLRDIKAENPEYLHRCGQCFLKNLCEQCPAKAWSETGQLDVTVQYFCEISHEIARRLGWLKDGEWAWEVSEWKERIIQKEITTEQKPID